MTRLKDVLSKPFAEQKQNDVPVTLRLSQELDSYVRELADMQGLSKQKMLLALIEEGIAIANEILNLQEYEDEDSLEYEEVPGECTFWLLNTNRGNNQDHHRNMVSRGEAQAYWSKKFEINRIQQGDIVFLYGNAEGIVAFGTGTGNTLTRPQDGYPDECHYQVLTDFQKLKVPMPASEIKKIVSGIVFLKTLSRISGGEKILDEIKRKYI